jgi:hypothetical protein
MSENRKQLDVFISRKSADKALANELYRYFVSKGLTVFESDETLPKLGSSDYRKAIDQALDDCKHMVVVGSSIEHIASSWVEAEWGFYIGEKRAGRKKGNILTVITSNLEIKDLPASLRYYEVVLFGKENFDRICAYVGKDYEDAKFKPSRKSILESRWLLPVATAICLLGVFWFVISERNKPFDATVFLEQHAEQGINALYPKFEGGEITMILGNKEERKSFLGNSEIVFSQIPIEFKGMYVPVKLYSKFWKLQRDSIELDKTAHLSIVPDGSLAVIHGSIKDGNGQALDHCEIVNGTDTTFFSNRDGFFKVELPYRMQKGFYDLDVRKAGYKSVSVHYFAGSGTTDIVLEKEGNF